MAGVSILTLSMFFYGVLFLISIVLYKINLSRKSEKAKRFNSLPLRIKFVLYGVILPASITVTVYFVLTPGASILLEILRVGWFLVGFPVILAGCEIMCMSYYKKKGLI